MTPLFLVAVLGAFQQQDVTRATLVDESAEARRVNESVLAALTELCAYRREIEVEEPAPDPVERFRETLEEEYAAHRAEVRRFHRLYLVKIALYREAVELVRRGCAEDAAFAEYVCRSCTTTWLEEVPPEEMSSEQRVHLGLLVFAALCHEETWKDRKRQRQALMTQLLSRIDEGPQVAAVVDIAMVNRRAAWPYVADARVGFTSEHLDLLRGLSDEIDAARREARQQEREDPYEERPWYPQVVARLLARVCYELDPPVAPSPEFRFAESPEQRLAYWQWRIAHEPPELWSAEAQADARELIRDMWALAAGGKGTAYKRFLSQLMSHMVLTLEPEQACRVLLDLTGEMESAGPEYMGRHLAFDQTDYIGPCLTLFRRRPETVLRVLADPKAPAGVRQEALLTAMQRIDSFDDSLREELQARILDLARRGGPEERRLALPSVPEVVSHTQAVEILGDIALEIARMPAGIARSRVATGYVLGLLRFAERWPADEWARKKAYEFLRAPLLDSKTEVLQELDAYLAKADPEKYARLTGRQP